MYQYLFVQEEQHGHTGLTHSDSLYSGTKLSNSQSPSIADHATAGVQVSSLKVSFFAETETNSVYAAALLIHQVALKLWTYKTDIFIL